MKAFIHPKASEAERKALEALLAETDCEIVNDLQALDKEVAAPEAADDEDDEDEEGPACLVILKPGLTEEDLQPELTGAIARGCRVIGIWGSGADGEMSPLADYGSDTVIWDPVRIREAVCGKPQRQAPDGGKASSGKRTHGGC